jgi:hypothetical protein
MTRIVVADDFLSSFCGLILLLDSLAYVYWTICQYVSVQGLERNNNASIRKPH